MENHRSNSSVATTHDKKNHCSFIVKWRKQLMCLGIFMFVAVGAWWVASVMEVQARAKAQAKAVAQEIMATSVQMVQEAKEEAIQVLSTRASQLSKNYQTAWEDRKAKAEAQAKAISNSSSKGTTTSTARVSGATFDAGAYGYTGSDQIPAWQAINSDVMGWLRIPGTNISHAIVQNTQDVNYYTHRGYYHENSYYGVIWTNPNTTSGTYSQLSPNTVLYGHNWTNYSANPRVANPNDIMFGQLTGYHHLSTAQRYPYFYYSTPQEEFTVAIFACFYTEEAFQYNQPFGANGDMSYTIEEARRRSRHKFDIDVNATDKIVTLSTCTRAYGKTSNQRFVVMGRVLRPGETIGPMTVTSNPDHKQPNVW